MIGRHLTQEFCRDGIKVSRIVRQRDSDRSCDRQILWDPHTGDIDASLLEGVDVVIHLAGAGIAEKRWTEERKREILDSRITGTQFLARKILELSSPPSLFISASAVGYYGDRPAGELLDEDSSAGYGFLPDVCKKWEESTAPLAGSSITRLVFARFGVVLSRDGGMLARQMPIFNLGLGGYVGNGRQMISWVSIEDLPGIMLHIIEHEEISGPVNIVAPNPVSNKEFTAALGEVLNRPAFFKVPSFGAKLLFGQMSKEILLAGQNVKCRKLLESGYHFFYPDLKPAIKSLLSK